VSLLRATHVLRTGPFQPLGARSTVVFTQPDTQVTDYQFTISLQNALQQPVVLPRHAPQPEMPHPGKTACETYRGFLRNSSQHFL